MRLNHLLQYVLLFASASHALSVSDEEHVVFGMPESFSAVSNLSDVDTSFGARDLLSLEARQGNCYSPNGYCSNSGRCCPPDYFKCCPNGCGRTEDGACCGSGTCKPGSPLCCWNNLCIGYQDECCSTEGWACPAPFKCVLYSGQQGCCTDLKCTVYLGTSGTTVTRTIDQVAPSTIRQTIDITPPPVDRTVTVGSGRTTVEVPVGGDYTIYYTTYYWTYWYYYYTFYYYAALSTTTTTRTITTITETTTLTCSATDTFDAESIFTSLSADLDLPTPSDANSIIPAEPTAGAIIIGNCGSESSSSSSRSGGVALGTRSSSSSGACETVTASGSSSRTRTGSGSQSTGFSGGGASGVDQSASVNRMLGAIGVVFAVFVAWL